MTTKMLRPERIIEFIDSHGGIDNIEIVSVFTSPGLSDEYLHGYFVEKEFLPVFIKTLKRSYIPTEDDWYTLERDGIECGDLYCFYYDPNPPVEKETDKTMKELSYSLMPEIKKMGEVHTVKDKHLVERLARLMVYF